MSRPVTERDLRIPEFIDAKVEDLEFREDGTVVRKDRWERGFRKIAYAMGHSPRAGFEIEDVADRVVTLAEGILQAVGDDIWAGINCEMFDDFGHL